VTSLVGTCDRQLPSRPFEQTPWQQQRLQLDRVADFATGQGITVAVVDTGVDMQNPQLAPVRDVTKAPASFVGLDTDNIPPIRDCDGHGTFVAGLIAAPRVPGIQFHGVAPGARILPVRVTEGRDGGLSDNLADGIFYAVDQGADIINVSVVTDSNLPKLRDAIAYALSRNIVVVVAAGNSGNADNAKTWPAEYAREKGFEGLIVVGATQENGAIAPFSTTSVPVSVVAPGANIWSTAPVNGHAKDDGGTSFSAPLVSGVAALLLQAYDEALSPVEVKRRIQLTADRPGRDVPDAAFGWGVVNPYEAVTAILPDAATAPPAKDDRPAIAPIAAAEPVDATARDTALGVAAGAIGLSMVTLGVVAIVRRGHARSWRLDS
jgi:membrane-anchored mycosin MYCP